MEKKTHAMVNFPLKITASQREFLARFKSKGGNPSHLIRIALDKEIARIETEEKKLANYNNLAKWEQF